MGVLSLPRFRYQENKMQFLAESTTEKNCFTCSYQNCEKSASLDAKHHTPMTVFRVALLMPYVFCAEKDLGYQKESDWLDLLKYIASPGGYQIIEASSDFDSIREAIASRPDLILLNFKYLGTNAIETLSSLHVDESARSILVIVL